MDYNNYLSDLSNHAVAKLTSCLARQPVDGIGNPSEEWLLEQERQLTGMSKELLRPKSIFKRLTIMIAETTKGYEPSWIPQAAVLCDAHKSFNPCLIRRLFILLATEVTMRCDRIRAHHGGGSNILLANKSYRRLGAPTLNHDKPGEPVPVDNVEVAGFVDRMNAINGLWVHEIMWARYFNAMPGAPRFERVVSCCEACILSAVGGNAQHLVDLRANLMARTRQNHCFPRLMRFVDGWMLSFGPEMAEEMRNSSEALGSMLSQVRDAATKKHRKKKKRKDEKRRGQSIKRTSGDGGSGGWSFPIKSSIVSGSMGSIVTKEGVPLPRHATKQYVDEEDMAGESYLHQDDGEFNERDERQEQEAAMQIMEYYYDRRHNDQFGMHPAFSEVGFSSCASARDENSSRGQKRRHDTLDEAGKENRARDRRKRTSMSGGPAPRPRNMEDAAQSVLSFLPWQINTYDERKRGASYLRQQQQSEFLDDVIQKELDGDDDDRHLLHPYRHDHEGANRVSSNTSIATHTREYIEKYRPTLGIDHTKSPRPRKGKNRESCHDRGSGSDRTPGDRGSKFAAKPGPSRFAGIPVMQNEARSNGIKSMYDEDWI